MQQRLGRVSGLNKYFARSARTPTCTPAHLCEHLKCPLRRTELRKMDHPVRIENTHHTHIVKIQSFTNHLGTHQDIDLPAFKLLDDLLVSVLLAGGIKIHPQYPGGRKKQLELILQLF